MPECRKCKQELVWKQPYHKGDRPIGINGKPHFCGKKRYTGVSIEWERKWDTIWRFKVPIFCDACGRSFKREAVCQHIRNDGFIEGTDTCEFYSDKWSSVQRRKNIKADRKRKAAKAK